MLDTAIYLGPSLDAAQARAILRTQYLPPIRRDDLGKLGDEIKTVGIIDGEFYQSLAVSPKEVLRLLERGVRVFGSSSMGALRAAETHIYGMVGVGRVFEMYRDGKIDADDEVALTYDPETYRSMSEPLVNIRCALEGAVAEGVLAQSTADEIICETKALYFPYRSYRQACKVCPEFKGYLQRKKPDQKRDDAILLLQTLAGVCERPQYSLTVTATFSVL